MPTVFARLSASDDFCLYPCTYGGGNWQEMASAFDSFEKSDEYITLPNYNQPRVFQSSIDGTLTVKLNILYNYMGSPWGVGGSQPPQLEIVLVRVRGTAQPEIIHYWYINLPETTTEQYLALDAVFNPNEPTAGPLATHRIRTESPPIPVIPGENYAVWIMPIGDQCPRIIKSGSTIAYELERHSFPSGMTLENTETGGGSAGGSGTATSGGATGGDGTGTGGGGTETGGGTGTGGGTTGGGGDDDTDDGASNNTMLIGAALILFLLVSGGKKRYLA